MRYGCYSNDYVFIPLILSTKTVFQGSETNENKTGYSFNRKRDHYSLNFRADLNLICFL
jgi:hypothetical protein